MAALSSATTNQVITFVALIGLVTLVPWCFALPSVIRVGGIFAEDELEEQLVFHAAMEHLNTNYNGTIFEAHVQIVNPANSFVANLKTCELLRTGPVAIIGPFNEINSMQVQSVCENFEIPHIEARLMLDFRPRSDLSINLFPHLSSLSKVFLNLLEAWEWKSFVIIYEESERIIHFNQLLLHGQEKNWVIKFFQLLPNKPYRDVLWEVKETQVTNVLLDVRTEHIVEVLRQAQQVGILTDKHNYLITSLDLHTLDIEDYRHSKTNITSLRIVNEDHPILQSLLQDWHSYSARYMSRSSPVLLPAHLKSQSAMVYDGMQILAQALHELNQFEMHPIDCKNNEQWQHGTTVINYIRQVQHQGITGLVNFGNSGFRSSLSFDIISVTDTDFELIAHWNNDKLIKTDNWKKHSFTKDELELIRVTTFMNPPFVMHTRNSKELKGNDRYEGFVPDLMMELSNLLSFRFEIHIVKDKKYGAMINATTNEWDGMIGEVLRGDADIAVADLTINSDREVAVDFTYPFMATGISILYKKPTTRETSLWSFLSPFSPVVWIYLLTAFAGVSLIMFYIGRFTPYEWANPHPCNHHEPVLENACNMRNSFWCTIGSLMQQGSDVAPKALSTRVICAIWYFFTLIVVSSYTANLAAFLTVEKEPFPFENVNQLGAQTKIKYGCVANGSTHKFFQFSKTNEYKKMADMMDKWGTSVMTVDNSEGRAKVEKEEGKYAFFMESATIEHIIERYCNLTQIGGLLDNKGYGVATKKGSRYRAPLSEAILKLQETGVLQQLKDRWWKQKGGGQCVAKASSTLTELGLRNLGGVFVVLVVGSLFALMLGICEFLIKTRMSTVDKTSYRKDLWEEFKFVLSCHKPTKVLKRKSVKSLNGSRIFDHNNRVMSPGADSASIPMTPSTAALNSSMSSPYI